MAFDIVLWSSTGAFDVELTTNSGGSSLTDPAPTDTSTTSEVISFNFSLNFTDTTVVTSEPGWSTILSWLTLRIPKGSNLTTSEMDWNFTQMNALKLERAINVITSGATITPSAAHAIYTVSALAENAEFAAPTGTFADGQSLVLKIKDDGTSRTLTWPGGGAAGSTILNASAGNYLYRTANLPSPVAFSFGGWFRWDGSTGAIQTLFGLTDAPTWNAYSEIYINNSDVLTISMFASDTSFTLTPTPNEWFYLAVSCSGTGANQFVARWYDDTMTLQDTATRTSPSFTPTYAVIGETGVGVGDPFKDRVAQARLWDAALSQAELETEMASSVIVRTANINTAFAKDYTVDDSGNSRPWSTSGSPAIDDVNYPPLSFGGGAYRPIGVVLPTHTVSNKWLYVGCIYNAADACWDVVSVLKQ